MSHQTHLIMASAPSRQKTSVLGTACVSAPVHCGSLSVALCRMQGSVLRPLLASLKGCIGSFAFCLAGCHSELYCLHLILGPRLFFLYFPVLNGHHWEQADRVELLLEAITIITEVATGPGKLMGHLKYSQINGIQLST